MRNAEGGSESDPCNVRHEVVVSGDEIHGGMGMDCGCGDDN